MSETRRSRAAVACTIAAALALSVGCSAEEQPTESSTPSVPVAQEWEEVAAPEWPYTDFNLPASCFIEDLDGDFAVYQQNLHQRYPGQSLGLLALATGEYFTVLEQPVMAERGYFMCSPRIGDGWIAWEEVSPNEAANPDNADWRLYAAPLDFAARRAGEPVLVDSGNTSIYVRPFYGFDGDTLVWSRNLVAKRQEMPQHHSELMSRVLSEPDEAVLFESPRNWRAMCVEGDTVTIIESPEPSELSERVVVLDAATCEVTQEFALPEGLQSAHFARVATEGTVLYAAFANQAAQWPDLYVAEGDVQGMVRARSMDPVGVGDYFVFERVLDDGTRGLRSQLWGLSVESRSVFLLDERSKGLWQTPMCASTNSADGVLAVALDLAPYVDDQSQARTIVRVYRLP